MIYGPERLTAQAAVKSSLDEVLRSETRVINLPVRLRLRAFNV